MASCNSRRLSSCGVWAFLAQRLPKLPQQNGSWDPKANGDEPEQRITPVKMKRLIKIRGKQGAVAST